MERPDPFLHFWYLLIRIFGPPTPRPFFFFLKYFTLFLLEGFSHPLLFFMVEQQVSHDNMGAIRSHLSLDLHRHYLPTMQREREVVTLHLEDLFKIISHLFSQESGDFPVLKLEQCFLSSYYFALPIDYVHLTHPRALIEIRDRLC